MVFKNMMKDNIQILKADGTESDEMEASVQDGAIYLMKSDILIESGDFIKRKMSNGGIETLEVITPGFYEGIQSIPAHYQMKVKKLECLKLIRLYNLLLIILAGQMLGLIIIQRIIRIILLIMIWYQK